MEKHKWSLIFYSCLLGFTTYAALDTFVIKSTYQENATEMNLSMFESLSDTSAAGGTDTVSRDTSAAGDSDNVSRDTSAAGDTGTISRGSSAEDGENAASPESKNKRKKAPGRERKDSKSTHSYGRRYSSDASGQSSDAEDKNTEPVTLNNASETGTYKDDNVSITLTEYTTNDTKIYVADIILSSAKYLKTAFAKDTYGKNITEETSDMAEANNAILAINGDYYGAREKGYVIRNGVIYRETPDDADLLCIYADGTMGILEDQASKTPQELLDEGVWQAFSFGPALLINGEIAVTEDEEVGRAMASNPRTAIGLIDQLHYLFVVSDGRTEESEGLSLYELASFMEQLGADTAYNLDGGGSSTMVFQGEITNMPTTGGNRITERKVSDIVYIG